MTGASPSTGGLTVVAATAKRGIPPRSMRCASVANHPGVALRQCVIVLGDGNIDDRPIDADGLTLTWQAVYLRDLEPARVLADPRLVPLVALTLADGDAHRADLLREGLETLKVAGVSTYIARRFGPDPRADDIAAALTAALDDDQAFDAIDSIDDLHAAAPRS